MKWISSVKNKWSLQRNMDSSNMVGMDSFASPEAFHSLIKNHPDPVCLFDFKGDIITYNQRLLELVDLPKEDCHSLRQTFSGIFRHFYFEQAVNGKPQVSDDVLTHQDGQLIHVNIVHIPILVEGDVKGCLCVIKDTSEIVKTEKTYTEAIKKMRDIVNNLDIAVWAVDLEKQKVIFCSNAYGDIYGAESKNLKVDTWKSFVHPDDLDEVIQRQQSLFNGETIRHSYRIVTLEGEVKWVKDHTIPVKNSKGKVVRLVGFVADISETKTLQHKLHDMAYYDELTGLPNRYFCRETIKEWIDRHQKEGLTFACFYLNLDGLNRVNDTLGYEIGDEVLKKTAQKMLGVVQDNGLVSRLGGDEFIVLVRHQEKLKDYYQMAQRLIDVTEGPLHIGGCDIYVTTSIGISLFSSDSKDYLSLVRNARTALRRAKRFGKDNYQVYAANMDIQSFKLFQLDSDLRKAIADKEFFLEYQPRIDTKTQRAVGAEALIRWDHPLWGIVSPAEFIPLAEENSKMIQQIGEFVFQAVCQQIKTWQKEGIPFSYISLNLSAKNFLKENLVDWIEICLNTFGTSPSMIEIEVTESSMLLANEIVEKQLTRMKEMGIRIALDDYGTGYSSIPYLKRYPVSTIKIDRSFIQDLTNREDDAVIIKSIIDMSRGLNKNVVAEGVETREQFDLLKKYGCHEIQGYLFSKPVSAEEIRKIFFEDIVNPKQQIKPSVERRRYYRIDLPLALRTQMTILSFSGKELSLGSTEVLIQDIGLGGIRFTSHLRLMPHADIVYGFETVIMGADLKLNGKIVWDRETKMNIFEYGLEFLIEETDRDHLATLLNSLSLKLRSNPLFNDGNFITESALAYIKKHDR